MKLQGRDLSHGLQGDDVKLLQSELLQLGFAIPATEVASATFGRATFDAVGSFQAKNRLAITNTVDPVMANSMSAAVDALLAVRKALWSSENSSDASIFGFDRT